jgi:hypothetical protein
VVEKSHSVSSKKGINMHNLLHVNIPLGIVLAIIWCHFIGDFPLQCNWMAHNKWNKIVPLIFHSFFYGLPFILFFGWNFFIVTSLLHGAVDFFSSKITHVLWEKKKSGWFFRVIGFDQAIHYSLLLMTYIIFFN